MKRSAEKKQPDKFITVQHVAERLSVTDHYVYSLIREGYLETIRIGPRSLRVSEQSLEKFIESQKVDPMEYFAPKEPAEEPIKETSSPRVARSNWMSK